VSFEPHFVCDVSWHRHGDGTTLVAGSPLGVFSLSEAGRDVARALEQRQPLPDFHRPLTSRLEAAGALHPRAVAVDGPLTDLLTIVIPAHVTDRLQLDRLEAMVDALGRSCAVVVVDDASPNPLDITRTAKTVRLAENVGPGAARNAGLREVTTPFVAFVDADVTRSELALPLLVATCQLDGVALAAPRVASRPARGLIARYEQGYSPLDLGELPGRIAPGSRLSYAPSAMWVVRTDVARSLGGFDEKLRVGEDVDFLWRLVRAGHTARYEPRATVLHEPRTSLKAFLVQRFRYGTSVGSLSMRHPGTIRPLKASWHSVVLWAAFFAGLPIVSVALGFVTFIGLARRLRHLDNGIREAGRLVVRGHWAALPAIVRALRREWIVVTAVALMAGGYFSVLAVATLVIAPLIDYVRGPRRGDPLSFVVMRFLDDAAYGVGAVVACIRHRTIKPLVPDLRTWRATVS
jgi:mycofactocin system glycosyltransferase